jgi:hypothetical protein
MKVVKVGNTYNIYDDTLETFDLLPAQAYTVRFNPMSGFYLEPHAEIEINESKIYGVHIEKVKKVLRFFDNTDRNLGVILSGDKGIGKSLFAKILSSEAIKKKLPLIIVDKYMPNIAAYLESIEQEVVVLFDEFDKTFGDVKSSNGEVDPQATMLSLFDGLSQGKKLFIITCNEIQRLNGYLLNRPGRFHYHFRFDYPNAEEVNEYLKEKLNEKYYSEIKNVVSFSRKVNLNYDCLRAIACELNTGEPFNEAIKDLNIMNLTRASYIVTLHFENGVTMKQPDAYLDLFDKEENYYITLYDNMGRNLIDVEFKVENAHFDMSSGMMMVNSNDLTIKYDADDDYADEVIEEAKKLVPKFLTIKTKESTKYHYTV